MNSSTNIIIGLALRFHGKLYIPVLLAALAITSMAPARTLAVEPELAVAISDTTVTAGDSSAWLSVFVTNYQDSVAGFVARIILGRPDIMEFCTDLEDTIIDTAHHKCIAWVSGQCVDSVPADPPIIDTFFVNGGIDTTGSLISYWEFSRALSLDPGRNDITILGLAEHDAKPPYRPAFEPRETPGLLCRLNVRVYDELPLDDSTVMVFIEHNLSATNFADPQGFMIGTVTDYNICDSSYLICSDPEWSGGECNGEWLDTIPGFEDTLMVDTFFRYWHCLEWGQDSQGLDSCLAWAHFSHPDSAANADSISIDSIPWTVWNDSAVSFDDGSLRVAVPGCGDANGDFLINVADPVYVINFIFKSGAPPDPLCIGDANGDGLTNIGDAVYVVNFVFKNGSPPVSGCCRN